MILRLTVVSCQLKLWHVILSHNIVQIRYPFRELQIRTFKIMAANRKGCVFCQLYDNDVENKVLYKDEEYCVFPDIRPAAKHHYLVITKEHIPNPKILTADQKDIIKKLVEIGKRVLEEKGGDLSDVRFGFHWPPFNSIGHLHLHVISPTTELGFVARLIFKPDTYWFYTPEAVLARMG